LGPAGADALYLLRRAHAVWRWRREVTYLLRHVEGWTVVTGATRAPMDSERAPDPAELVAITAVETSCPLHATPDDVRTGRLLPDAESVLGLPGDVDYRPGLAQLRYRGLVIGARRMRVQWLRVIVADLQDHAELAGQKLHPAPSTPCQSDGPSKRGGRSGDTAKSLSRR